MICPKCNSELPDSSEFCNKCGANIKKYGERKIKKILPFSIGITLLIAMVFFLLTNTTSINFDESNIELFVGETYPFVITIKPDLARNKQYTLMTQNDDLISIKDNNVIAKKSGTAKIVLKQDDKEFDVCTIKIKDIEPTDIRFDENFSTILVGREYKLPIIFTPENTSDIKINYSVSDDELAEIKNGVIIGKKEGTLDIVAKHITKQLETKTTITISPVQPETISINNDSVISLGDTIIANISSNPSDITYKDYKISSSNSNIISVSKNELTAKKVGNATITVTHSSGVKTSKEFEVKPVDVLSVKLTLDETILSVGDKKQIKNEILPENATDKTLKWTSSDTNIATVDKTGNVNAKKPGNVTITASSSNDKSSSIKITIKPKPVSASNGFVKRPSGSREAPVTIHAPKDSNCYVYFKNIANNSNSFSMYVAKNTTCEVNAPIGTYEMYYATGSTWYGSEYKFGDGTGYFKADSTFTFYYLGNYVYGTEVTLYSVINGNLDSDPISESAFPD